MIESKKSFTREELTQGIKIGIAKALLKHKMNNRPIYIGSGDKVIEVPPDKIDIPQGLLETTDGIH